MPPVHGTQQDWEDVASSLELNEQDPDIQLCDIPAGTPRTSLCHQGEKRLYPVTWIHAVCHP